LYNIRQIYQKVNRFLTKKNPPEPATITGDSNF